MYVIETLKAYGEISVFLLPVVLALVTFWGRLGAKGTWQLLSSLATGLVLGGVMMWAELQPVDVNGWLAVAFYGLILGLTASGVYEVGKSLKK